MSKRLLQSILRHRKLDQGTVHWRSGDFSFEHEVPKGARFTLDEGAIYEQFPCGKLSAQHVTCAVVLTAANESTVWIDENADEALIDGLLREFMEPAAAATGCTTGT